MESKQTDKIHISVNNIGILHERIFSTFAVFPRCFLRNNNNYVIMILKSYTVCK